MNALQELCKEHRHLKKSLDQIERQLFEDDLKDAADRFVDEYRRHEREEHEAIEQAADQDPKPIFYRSYERIHSETWDLLNHLKHLAGIANKAALLLTYENLRAMILSHFEYEERCLFPRLRKRLGRGTEETSAGHAEEKHASV